MSDTALHGLAAEIAIRIGEGWTARQTDDSDGVYLEHPDKGSLFLRRQWRNAARVDVGGRAAPSHPRQAELLHHIDLGHITVAADRGADAIAADIRRRLLPRYATGLALYRSRVDDHEKAAALRADAAQRLADALGGERSGDTVKWDARSGAGRLIWGSFEPLYDGDRVRIELTVPVVTAVGVARAVSGSGAASEAELVQAVRRADLAAYGDSNDGEIDALREALGLALGVLGIERLELDEAAIEQASQRCEWPAPPSSPSATPP